MELVGHRDPWKKSHIWLDTFDIAEAATRAYGLWCCVLLIPLAQGQDLFILSQDTVVDLNLLQPEISPSMSWVIVHVCFSTLVSLENDERESFLFSAYLSKIFNLKEEEKIGLCLIVMLQNNYMLCDFHASSTPSLGCWKLIESFVHECNWIHHKLLDVCGCGFLLSLIMGLW